MIDRRGVFDQPLKNDIRIYDDIQNITIKQGENYTTVCLLDYSYLKKHYQVVAIDLSKQKALDVDPKAIQQINFTEILWKKQKKLFWIF